MRALFVFIAISCFLQSPAFAQTKYSILQGSTSETVTHFNVVAPASEPLRFEVISNNESQPRSTAKIERVTHPGSEWVVYRMRFEGLKHGDRYILRTLDSSNRVTDQRGFKTLRTHSGAGRIALVSCMMRQLHNPFMWNALAKPENRPDLLLLLGDAVYLDRSRLFFKKLPENSLEVWEDFVKSRNRLNLYYWQNLVPILSVWDDHDSGGDNVSAKSYQMMNQVRVVYDTFFANEEIEGTLKRGPGLAKQFEAFGKNFVILDGRSFRELDDENPLFGQEQEDWLVENIRPGGNLIASGTQFYGGSLRKDSLEFHWPEAAVRFTKRLRTEGERLNASFVFASGDVHFSEVQKLEPELFGYETLEITSSSAHSFAFPGHYLFKPENPRRVVATGTHNVVLMEMDSSVLALDFKVRALSWRGKTLFSENVSVGGPCEQWLASRKVL